jgi:hypothetical protein
MKAILKLITIFFLNSNPALRSGPHRTFRPGVPLRRLGRSMSAGGWDTDGNDYALSLGSGSERSFVGR